MRNWICNLGNLSPTRAICTTASQEMTCFLLFDKLCDYTVQNLVVGSSNSDDGTYKTDKERSIKIENYLKNVGQFDPVPQLGFFYVTRSSACRVYKRVCSQIAVHLLLLLISDFKQSLETDGQYMDI